MRSADELRGMAGRALRLARDIDDERVSTRLKLSAAEYLAMAEELEARPTQQQQQPPPPNKKDG
jgi:hypothetical protein